MTPTEIEIEVIKRKLEEAKTIEEKRLIVESLLSYVEHLRELLGRRENSMFTIYVALIITVPVQLLANIKILLYLLPCLTALAFVYVRYIHEQCQYMRKKISQIYEILLDPPMPQRDTGSRKDRDYMYDVIYWTSLVIVILTIIIAIVKTIL